MRIFITGDNHIGLKYARCEKAAILVESRMKAFEGMVNAANKEECALFVITGDLFENTYGVSKKDIKALLVLFLPRNMQIDIESLTAHLLDFIWVDGKRRIKRESFEKWYANQNKYTMKSRDEPAEAS